jgi:hypothetical protein
MNEIKGREYLNLDSESQILGLMSCAASDRYTASSRTVFVKLTTSQKLQPFALSVTGLQR